MRDNYIFATINRNRWVGDVIARFGFFRYFSSAQLNLFDANYEKMVFGVYDMGINYRAIIPEEMVEPFMN